MNSNILKLSREFIKKAQEFGYSGRAQYEDTWKDDGLWELNQTPKGSSSTISQTLLKLIESSRFSSEGSFDIDIGLDEKANVNYYIVGDLAHKDPKACKRLELALKKTFGPVHQASLKKANISSVLADRWNWIKGMEIG